MNKIDNEQIEKIKKFLEEKDIQNIYLAFVDLKGKMFYKSVGVEELIKNTHVSWFDGISINGNLIKDFKDNKKSEWMVLLPDSNAFYYLPFIKDEEQKAGIIMCNLKNHPYDTRMLLKKAVQEYTDIGLTPIIGPELIYSTDNITKRQDFYSSLPVYPSTIFNNKVVNNILAANIDIEYYMPFGKEHNRIDLVPDVADISADKLFICKWFVENIAYLENTKINFNNIQEENLSSCPVHFSVWKGNREKNLFFDGDRQNELSILGEKFINGILYYNKFIKAIIKSCTNNQLKEHIVKFSNNRDNSLIHVPLYFNEKQKKDRIGWSKRCIFNGLNSDCNFYLVFACILYAGLYGINSKKTLSIEERLDNYTNEEYIEEIKRNKYFNEKLGEGLISKIIRKMSY